LARAHGDADGPDQAAEAAAEGEKPEIFRGSVDPPLKRRTFRTPPTSDVSIELLSADTAAALAYDDAASAGPGAYNAQVGSWGALPSAVATGPSFA